MGIKYTRLGGMTAFATVTALLFAACGNGTGDVAAPPLVEPPATGEVIAPETLPAQIGQCADITGTVNFRWWGGDGRAALQQEAIEAFNAMYPNITVNTQPMAFSGYWDQLQIEAIAGNTPDLFTANEAWISSLVSGNVLADLRTIDTVDLSNFSDDALGVAVSGNHVYAIPTGGNAAAMLVNFDILEEVGVSVPDDSAWSWDDFHALATEISSAGLTNHNGDAIFGVSSVTGQLGTRIWANQADGGMFTADGELNWSQDAMEEYLTFLQDMIDSGATPDAVLQTEYGQAPGESMMALGRAAFQPQWSNQLAVASPPDANIGLLRMPGDHTSTHMGTWLNPTMFFGIASNAQDPEAAGCLLDFMVNHEQAATIMGIDRGVPFNPAMLAVVEPALSGPNLAQAEFMEKIAQDGAVSIPLPELTEDINLLVIQFTDPVIFGLMTPAAAAAGMHAALNDARIG